MHLSEDTYRQLLDGTLPGPEARALADHLARSCEACEGFLAAPRAPDGLDGRVDQALDALAQGAAPSAGQGHDLEFRRVVRAVRGGGVRRRALPALAIAAAVAVAGLAGLLLARPPAPVAGWDGEKGGASLAIPLRLRFLVVLPGVAGPPALVRGVPGQEVPSVASLQFQVELGRPAHVLLARAGGAGAPEVFLSTRLPAGRSVVSVDGQPAAYPLAALVGPQRFLALASDLPLGPADAARAVAPEVGAGGGGDGPAISLDVVEVRVSP